ncbi:MAG: hypothetical protein IKN95_11355 [Lachnospiraceae bacterium]|nr:hypothetical protein [Lachnospiraceae bacterium]
MSMIVGLISAITNAERQIDDQIAKLNSYMSKVDKTINEVQASFGGTGDAQSQAMMAQLSITKKQIEDTLNNLLKAKEKLIRVRTV